jgi:hypothetical protein
MDISPKTSNDISFDDFKAQILHDYEIAVVSRRFLRARQSLVFSAMARNCPNWPWQGHSGKGILEVGTIGTKPS